ncbi:MAG: threonine--tRNA ligase, partial [Nitrospinota bacterium]
MTENSLETLRHSTAHLMAHAVKDLYPETKVTIGPATRDGFYYDFDREIPFSPEDLLKIEKRMKKLAKAGFKIEREELSKSEAVDLFKRLDEPYKVEIIEEISDTTVSLYRQGEFVDLCRGPHVPFTSKLKTFKLIAVAGSYWRGNEKNKMLQRIYGTAFFTPEELEAHLTKIEEAKKRDHRKIGKELDFFSIDETVGPGLALWHPKGGTVRYIIEKFWGDEHQKNGYQIVYTPHIAKSHLWKLSGHMDFYKENMFSPMDVDGMEYVSKPMNCPFHIKIYKSTKRSYRDLPVRWAELGTVYRYERSGVLHGLLRVRGFTQDDAHIFCREEQLKDEIKKVLDFTLFMLRSFGFNDFEVYLSTRPEKYVGSLEIWEKATASLRGALEDSELAFQVDPGEGVFYGPKIDIKIKDSLDRAWQCSTIQVDFNLPERFDVSYVGSDGKDHSPIMIHRALLGSLERFFGCLLEHYAGALPAWLAPLQVKVLTITDKLDPYARKVAEEICRAGLRAEADLRNEKIGKKIREARLEKIPYMLIVGEREEESGSVAIKKRGG